MKVEHPHSEHLNPTLLNLKDINNIIEHELNVTGMSCQKCVSKIRSSIQDKDSNAVVLGVPHENKLIVNKILCRKDGINLFTWH